MPIGQDTIAIELTQQQWSRVWAALLIAVAAGQLPREAEADALLARDRIRDMLAAAGYP